MQAPDPRVAELVGQLPNSDQPDAESKFTGPPWATVEKMCAEILAGGRERLVALVGLLRDPSRERWTSFRAEYLLHAIALYVGARERRVERRLFVETLASLIGDAAESKAVRTRLIEELQTTGGWGALDALGGALLDADLCEPAARALVALRRGAAGRVRAALPKAPAACRAALAQALGVLADAEAVGALIEILGDRNREVRICAVWALARTGDARGIDGVLAAVAADDGWESAQAVKAAFLLAEKLAAAGAKQEAARIYTHLGARCSDPAEKHIRAAAERGLEAAE
ncbi:MAG: hypothetical protein BWX69_01526 [Planctomycetes bacterium ADurb.Bin069]|jgi:HEAT repeat protein|nr:MAG: hypothetical protein BWX69_01526 [Planctomycetes bacterium ADurb.Bin069]